MELYNSSKKIGINLHELRLSSGFLDKIPKAQITKGLADKWTSSTF